MGIGVCIIGLKRKRILQARLHNGIVTHNLQSTVTLIDIETMLIGKGKFYAAWVLSGL